MTINVFIDIAQSSNGRYSFIAENFAKTKLEIHLKLFAALQKVKKTCSSLSIVEENCKDLKASFMFICNIDKNMHKTN